MKTDVVKFLKARLSDEQLDLLRSVATGLERIYGRAMYPYARFVKTPLQLRKNSNKRSRRLEIGPGPARIPGFETVNVHWGRHIDYIADASKKLPFERQTFDLIYASHVLEHMPWYLIAQTLKDWVSTLKQGGVIEIWVPNGYEIAKAFVLAEEHADNDIHRDGWYKFNEGRDVCIWANGRIFSYGDGTGKRGDPNWHLCMFSPRFLHEMMSGAGLVNVEPMASDQVRGNDHGWINLGFRGVKP